MLEGAYYEVVTMDRQKFYGAYIGERDGQILLVDRDQEGKKSWIDRKKILYKDRLFLPSPSNVWKALLAEYVPVSNHLFSQEIVYITRKNAEGNCVVYLKGDTHDRLIRMTEDFRQKGSLDNLIVGATYIFILKYEKIPHREGVFVGMSEGGAYNFVGKGVHYNCGAEELRYVYKVRNSRCFEVLGRPDVVAVTSLSDRSWQLFFKSDSKEMKREGVRATTRESFHTQGLYYRLLDEKMFLGTVSEPYQIELRPGDCFCAAGVSCPVFVDTISKGLVHFITSRDAGEEHITLLDTLFFQKRLNSYFPETPNLYWKHVPREDLPEYSLDGFRSSTDCHPIVRHCSPEEIIHIEFLKTGVFHVYSLADNYLWRRSFLQGHEYLRSNGRSWWWAHNYKLHCNLILGRVYTIKTQARGTQTAVFIQEKNGYLWFYIQDTANGLAFIEPGDLLDVSFVANKHPEESPFKDVVLLFADEEEYTFAYLQGKDTAAPFALIGGVSKHPEREEILLSGF